jgi:hypothetical protein
MPVQRADDAGRELPNIWLGPSPGVRWPVDWTFATWGMCFVLALSLPFLFAFVVPTIVILGPAIWFGGAALGRRTMQEAPGRMIWAGRAGVALLALLFFSDLASWLQPMWPVSALLAGPCAAVWFCSRYQLLITWNRPLMHWLRLPGLAAAGPRARPGAAYDVAALVDPVGLDLASPSSAVRDLDVVPVHVITEAGRAASGRNRSGREERRAILLRTPQGLYSPRLNIAINWKVAP